MFASSMIYLGVVLFDFQKTIGKRCSLSKELSKGSMSVGELYRLCFYLVVLTTI